MESEDAEMAQAIATSEQEETQRLQSEQGREGERKRDESSTRHWHCLLV